MKKKIFSVLFIIALGIVATFNINMNKKGNKLGDFVFANLEALATGEGEGSDEYLAWGSSHSCEGWLCPKGGSYTECEVNGSGNQCTTKGDRTCTCGSNCNPCS